MKITSMLAAGCVVWLSGCGLFLERYPEPEDAGVDEDARINAFAMDASRDVSEELDALVIADAFIVPDAFALPDAFGPEYCNGVDDDRDRLTDEDDVCLAGAIECTPEFFGGHTYLLCDGNVNWPTARTNCNGVPGFHMVKIETSAENDFVQEMAGRLDWMRADRMGWWDNSPRLWIGLGDAGSRVWTWTDGSALESSDFWRAGEPMTLEDCVEMRRWPDGRGGFEYGWNDTSCYLTVGFAFLCESEYPAP